MSSYNHFYEMPVYKKCRIFRRKISLIVRENFPKEEKFLLSAQAMDAARSINANMAEGFGRFHHQENIQFCRQSRGSLTETMEHMISAFDEKYITKQILKEINAEYKAC